MPNGAVAGCFISEKRAPHVAGQKVVATFWPATGSAETDSGVDGNSARKTFGDRRKRSAQRYAEPSPRGSRMIQTNSGWNVP